VGRGEKSRPAVVPRLRMSTWKYFAEVFLQREMFQTNVVDKIKTQFSSTNSFSRKSYRSWDNVEKYGRARQATDGNIKRLMHLACYIRGYRYTLRICYIYWFTTATMVTRTRLGVNLHVHCVSLVVSITVYTVFTRVICAPAYFAHPNFEGVILDLFLLRVFTMFSLIIDFWIDNGIYSAKIMIIINVIIDKLRLFYKITTKYW
jgi:hypothetical protein